MFLRLGRKKRQAFLLLVAVLVCFYFSDSIYDTLFHYDEVKYFHEWRDHAARLPQATYVNMTELRNYMNNNDVCKRPQEGELLAILVVSSSLGHFRHRTHMRNSMPQAFLSGLHLKRIFLIGDQRDHQQDNGYTERKVRAEIAENGDMLRGNFVDTYRNNSFKNLMGLDWAARECSDAAFIVKMDDDIILDIYYLVENLQQLRSRDYALAESGFLMMGKVAWRRLPLRRMDMKWSLSSEEYHPPVFPDFLMGCLYVTNAATVERVVGLAERVPVLWIDDIWLTGLLRASLNIALEPWPAGVYTSHKTEIERCIREMELYELRCDRMFYHKTYEPQLMYRFHEVNRKCHTWGAEIQCHERSPLRVLRAKIMDTLLVLIEELVDRQDKES